MEMQGLTHLRLSKQDRNDPTYAELEPEPLLQVHPLRECLLGHHLSYRREEKVLESCTVLAEIPEGKAAAGENRVCYWHQRTN